MEPDEFLQPRPVLRGRVVLVTRRAGYNSDGQARESEGKLDEKHYFGSCNVPGGGSGNGNADPGGAGQGIAELEGSKKAFLDATKGLSEAQWNFKSAPDRWSVAECADHIALAEGFIFGRITDGVMKTR